MSTPLKKKKKEKKKLFPYLSIITVYIYTIVSVIVTYTKSSMGKAKYHLMNRFLKNKRKLLRVSCIEHSSVYISNIISDNIKYTTINLLI